MHNACKLLFCDHLSVNRFCIMPLVHMSRPRCEDNIDHKGVARHSQDRNSADKLEVLELGVLVLVFVSVCLSVKVRMFILRDTCL